MSIKFSKYIRQGKRTFRFVRMGGGAYGCNIEYGYGYFDGDRMDGVYFSNDKHTEIESDPDERDGIGGMTTVRKRSLWMGSFLDGKKDGFCVELRRPDEMDNASFAYYEGDRRLSVEEFKDKSEWMTLSATEGAYCYGDSALIYDGRTLTYEGQIYREDKPYFCRVYGKKGESECGFFLGDTPLSFPLKEWETMPVDPIDEDGFSVLREMDFFYDGDLRYTVTEGLFADGKLHGMGTKYYDSNVNGYHLYHQQSGIFKNGEFVFGYRHRHESTGGRQEPAHFGYADRRDVAAYGDEILYHGMRYIGQAQDGVPNGIGCLFTGEDRMCKGSFEDGRLHGIGATYRLLEGEWVPYDFEEDRTDRDYRRGSFGIFVDGERRPDMTWEDFYGLCSDVKKV